MNLGLQYMNLEGHNSAPNKPRAIHLGRKEGSPPTASPSWAGWACTLPLASDFRAQLSASLPPLPPRDLKLPVAHVVLIETSP